MADSALTSPWDRGDHTDPPCVIHAEGVHAPGRVVTPQGDLLFMNLRGSFAGMAGQMGKRLAEQVRRGPIPFYADYVDTMLRRSSRLSGASGAAGWAARHWASRRLEKNLPAEFYNAARALSHGSGLELDTVLRASLMPETFLWILGQLQRFPKSTAAAGLEGAPNLSSTSAIIRAPAADSLLHGRNLDYFGINYWDREAAVIFYHPNDGMDYVSVTSAGVVGGGITAMNAAGLTLTVHQHFLAELDLDAVPIGYAGDVAMRSAHTIEQAVAILRDYPPVAGWTYILCEGDTGRTAVYEVGPGREHLEFIEPSQKTVGYTNQYWGSDFSDANARTYPLFHRANQARQKRIKAGLDAWRSPQDQVARPADIAAILADFIDPKTEKTRLYGPCVANVNTVSSVVFEPRHRRVWVGAGTSPTSRNWYIPFSMQAVDAHTGGPDPDARPFIVDRGWHHSAHGQAFELYRKACVRYWEGESDGRLLILIEHALALFPHEPNLHVLAGLLALRIGRAKRAEGAFRRALEQLTHAARRAEIGLFLAWALDLQGQRGAAKYLYKRILRDDAGDALTRTRARQGRWVRFSAAQAAKLPLDFVYAGVP